MKRLLPFLGFVALAALFGFGIWWNTRHESNYVPSPLIDKPAPAFDLPLLHTADRRVTKADLFGKPYVLNVWASWCFACGIEHSVLMGPMQELDIALIGYNLRDKHADALAWLARRGDPYDMVLVDSRGDTAIDFGVYGAPETFLIDAGGVIRYKHIGPLTETVIAAELQPAVAALAGSTP